MKILNYKTVLLASIVTMVFGATAMGIEEKEALDVYRWKNRVILVFEDSKGLSEKQAAAFSEIQKVKDRDLVILKVPKGSNELRTTYKVKPDSFNVILIGKDGGAKFQSSEVTKAEEFFTKIDSMPMRQQEMQQ